MQVLPLTRIWKFLLFIVLLLLQATQHAFATCSASGPTPALFNYGTAASQNVPAGGISPNASAASGSFRVTCSIGLTLQLLSTTSWLRYTAQNALTLSNGTDTIPYTIASNSTYTPAITSAGGSVGGPTGFGLLTLALLASGVFDIPLYVKTLPTTTWPSAGTYNGTQVLAIDGAICTGIGLPGVCLGSDPVSANITISMKLVVSKSCEFNTVPTLVDFGVVSFLSSANTIQLNASLRCTNQEDYLLYVDNGNNYSSGVRHMVSPAANSIAYDILQPNSTTAPLGVLTPLSRLGTGAIESVSFPMRITTGQTTPIAGTYTDNVRVVIYY